MRMKIQIGIGAALILAITTFGAGWLREYKLRVQAQANADSRDRVIEKKQSEIDELSKYITHVSEDGDRQVRELQKELSKRKTVAQALAGVQKSRPLVQAQALPDSPGKIAVDALAMDRALNECDQAAVELDVCGKNLRALQMQLAAAQEQHVEAEGKSKGWETATKGGTKLSRSKSNGKWMLIGAGVALIVEHVLLK